jgi:hypothetical protein
MRLSAVVAVCVAVASPWAAGAQPQSGRFEAAVQVASAISSEFDRTDPGIGGRVAWHPRELVGVEAEIDLYPRDFPERPAFSRSRVEGLFGATLGPRFDRVRPFARFRAGFLNVREAPEPLACILIFPPPLSCELAGGRTLPAFDMGGGVELFPTSRVVVRVDAGDRMLKYPGPVFDSSRTVRDRDFFSHDLRLAFGAGLRF